MRSVILGNDFLKDNDGSFKFLETNTSCAFPTKNINTYINKDVFDAFIETHGITKIDIINTTASLVLTDDLDYNQENAFSSTLWRFIYENYSETLSVQHWNSNNNTIPVIEDEEDRLIIRIAYDTNALVDDTYCRDNYNFLKLMYDNDINSIPKTYFNGGDELNLDSIGTTIRDNGNYPNFIIKKRLPSSSHITYPKLLKISTQEELQSLKTNLTSNEILQEYIVNTDDLTSNRLHTYRHYQFLFGGELTELGLFEPIVITNKCEVTNDIDYNDSNEVQFWERPKLIQKVSKQSLSRVHGDISNSVILSDNTITTVGSLEITDTVKTVDLYGLGIDDHPLMYREPKENVLTGSTLTTASVIGKDIDEIGTFRCKVTFNNGKVYDDTSDSLILKVFGGKTSFNKLSNCFVNDEIFVGNVNTNVLDTLTITNVEYYFDVFNGINIDVEDEDVFLRPLGDDNETFIIKHNFEPRPVEEGPREPVAGKEFCMCYYSDSQKCNCKDPCLYNAEECRDFRMNWIECCRTEPDCFDYQRGDPCGDTNKK